MVCIVDGEAIRLDDYFGDHLEHADVVASETGAADRVLTLGRLVGHAFIVVDFASPRDVNPRDVNPADTDIDNVSLTTIDEVLSVRNGKLERRDASAEDQGAVNTMLRLFSGSPGLRATGD